jgi:GTP-binding protein
MDKVEHKDNDASLPLKMQIANLSYDNFLGRLGIGRIYDGTVKVGQEVTITSNE